MPFADRPVMEACSRALDLHQSRRLDDAPARFVMSRRRWRDLWREVCEIGPDCPPDSPDGFRLMGCSVRLEELPPLITVAVEDA